VTGQARQPSFDEIVAALQKAIDEQMRATYSAKVIEEANNPTQLGRMESADAHARVTGPCGDTMEFFLRVNGTHIQAATFLTDGCGPTVACANMLTKMIVGQRIDEAWGIEPEALILALDGLPEEHVHCAVLAINTLQSSLGKLDQERTHGND
jgi:nitrogen fixation NifU-like protein